MPSSPSWMRLGAWPKTFDCARVRCSAILADERTTDVDRAAPCRSPPLEARRVTRARACVACWRHRNGRSASRTAVRLCLARLRRCRAIRRRARPPARGAGRVGSGRATRLFGLPILLWSAAATLLDSALSGRSPAELPRRDAGVPEEHGRILTSAATVAIVRQLAANADGFGAGFLMVPPPLSAALDSAGSPTSRPRRTRWSRRAERSACSSRRGQPLRKTSSFDFGIPPTSLVPGRNRFPRPGTDPGGEQIRIDRYVEPASPIDSTSTSRAR